MGVTVTSPSLGANKFKDGFYACRDEDKFVDGMDGVLTHCVWLPASERDFLLKR